MKVASITEIVIIHGLAEGLDPISSAVVLCGELLIRLSGEISQKGQ
jgi:hypothetical protein